ncbi:MAG: ABC transporter ATP-binding protein [Synechococcus sp.]
MSLSLQQLGRKVGNRWILRHLDLDVDDGECLALVGPSGCGKSTTLRLIAGLDPVDEGSILINHQDVTTTPVLERKVGMVFQSYALFPHLSVSANLELGLKVRGVPAEERQQRVTQILHLVQLEERANQRPSQLSGGQRQRVALARALLRDPHLYLLDEPMSNLDAQLREELRPELRRLVLNERKPVIYVTHDQHEAMAMADRIAVLRDGRLEQVATPRELYDTPGSLFVATFIGRPQINVLPAERGVVKAVRPEALRLQEDGMPCELMHREWLGSSQIWQLQSPLGPLRLLTRADQEVPAQIEVGWSNADEHRFDANTGQRVTA